MGGASCTIGRLRVEVALLTALSWMAVAAPAGVSLGMGVSIIPLISLVTVNDAPVALENLQSGETDASSERAHDSRNT